MRIDVKKFIFIGASSEIENFFQKAQKIGIIQFSSKQLFEPSGCERTKKSLAALKVLHNMPSSTCEVTTLPFDSAEKLCDEIIALDASIKEHKKKIAEIKQEIKKIEPFGKISLDQMEWIAKEGKRKVQYFFAKKEIVFSALPLLLIGSDEDNNYFLTISKETISEKKLTEIVIEEPIEALRLRIDTLQKQLTSLSDSLFSYRGCISIISATLAENIDKNSLNHAIKNVEPLLDGTLFQICGWVPKNKSKELYAVSKRLNIFMDEIALNEGEIAPTYLENRGLNSLGEELVHVYDTPSNSDKDPSLWVLAWFSLFFAMIIGDGGYGLIFLVAALFFRYKLGPLHGIAKKAWATSLILFICCILWGFAAGSFFGLSLPSDSPLRKYSLTHLLAEKKAAYHIEQKDDVWQYWQEKYPEKIDQTKASEWLLSDSSPNYEIVNKFTDNILLELSLFLGIIHIITSLLRGLRANIGNFGWIAFMLGAYFYIPYFLNATSFVHFGFGLEKESIANIGFKLMYGGIIFATIISLAKNKLLGLLEPMQSIQIFSDVLSYLRLYALGMAGAIVAAVINEFAAMSGWFLAFLLLVIGHTFNMTLALMGGLIHGLRLNFLEWYRYSFEGGGKLFRPLKKIS